jgi:hypothetical protein
VPSDSGAGDLCGVRAIARCLGSARGRRQASTRCARFVDKLLVCGIMAAQRQRLHTGTVAGAGAQVRWDDPR